MKGFLTFFAQRRKAMGYIVAALAEYITALLPQANPQNAQVLHAVVLALGFLLVYLPANDKPSNVAEFIDDVVRGDAATAKHAPVPDASLQG